VLLVHGGFGYGDTWAGQIPALVRVGYQAIVLDSRGHGRSALGNEPITYARLAMDISALVDALDIGPVHLVGWSDGGCAAMIMALRNPQQLRSLTLVGTPFNRAHYSEQALAAIDHFLGPHSPGLHLALRVRKILSPEPHLQTVFLRRMTRLWMSEPNMSAAQLGDMEVPTLVIAGDSDEFLSCWPDPLKVFKETAAAIPGARLSVIAGGSHSPHIQRVATFNHSLVGFLHEVSNC